MNKDFNFSCIVNAHKNMEAFDDKVKDAKACIDKFIKGYFIQGLIEGKKYKKGSDSGDMNTTNATMRQSFASGFDTQTDFL